MSPELSPVAATVWAPGRAQAGTLRGEENAPEGSVVAVPCGWESKDRSTTSVGPNPWPCTVILVVGGPTWRDSRIRAPGAADLIAPVSPTEAQATNATVPA